MKNLFSLPSQMVYSALKSPELIGLYKLLENNKFVTSGFGFNVPKSIFTLLKKITDKEGFTIRIRTTSLKVLSAKVAFKTLCVYFESTPVCFLARNEEGFTLLSYNKIPDVELFGSNFLSMVKEEDKALNQVPILSGLVMTVPGSSVFERFYEELRKLVINDCFVSSFTSAFVPIDDLLSAGDYTLGAFSHHPEKQKEWDDIMDTHQLEKATQLKLRAVSLDKEQFYKEYPSGINLVQEVTGVHGVILSTSDEILGFYDVSKKVGTLTLFLRPNQP